MKKWKVCCLILCVGLMMSGCKKEEAAKEEQKVETPAEETPTPTPAQEAAVVDAEVIDAEQIPEGMVKSYLTGEYVSEEIGNRRPVAVMISNIKGALPSSSTSQASVYYEAPVEGAITRIMAIFEDWENLEKIGSVRSCRDYFLDYAMGFDCIYVHFGQAVYALQYLDSDDIDNISCMEWYGDKVYYRTSDRKSPHNAYVYGDGIKAGIEAQNIRTSLRENYEPQFTFAWVGEEINLENGASASVIRPGYQTNEAWFEYNPENGLYYRYEYGAAQVDESFENTQLAVKNVIIQYTGWENYDENGYLNLYAGEGGKMQYMTNGKMVEGTWERSYEWGPEKYYDAEGNEITLNTGKTWICVVQDTYADRVEIS